MKTWESSYFHLFEAGPLSLSFLTKENGKCHAMLWKNSFYAQPYIITRDYQFLWRTFSAKTF